MVTWGANTVHTIGGSGAAQPPGTPAPAPSGFSFGVAATTPAPAPAGGGTTFSGFGGASPAPSSGSFSFGGAGAPAPSAFGGGGGGSLFGGSAPAPSGGGLFGAPAPAPGGFLGFSSSTTGGTSLFGTPTAAPQQQQPPQPQIPAHAALQAHMDVSARNEQNRILQKMHKIHEAYTTGPTTDVNKDENTPSHCFSTVLYNPATPQQRQFQAAMQSTGFRQEALLAAQPQPPQISDSDWQLYCVRNPDPTRYVPFAVVGAENLAARALSHQQQSVALGDRELAAIQQSAALVQQRAVTVQRQLAALRHKHEEQRKRLLQVMKHVEVARCFNMPLQRAELEAVERMRNLQRAVVEAQIVPAVARLADNASSSTTAVTTALQHHHRHEDDDAVPSPQVQRDWMNVMKEHRTKLTALTNAVQPDQRDLRLIRDRVVAP